MLNVVTSYGAVGNGVSDDTTAIQTALTAAGVQGKGTVYIPGGTYVISAALLQPSNVIMVGDGVGVTILYLASNANVPIIKNSNNNVSPGNTNLGVIGMTLDGNKANQTVNSIALFGINYTWAGGVTFQNLEVKNVAGTGIYMDGAGQYLGPGFCDSLYLHDNTLNGFQHSYASRRFMWSNILCESNGGCGAFIDASETTYVNVMARLNGGSSLAFYRAGIFIRNVTDATLIGLTAELNQQDGILIGGLVNSTGSSWKSQANSQSGSAAYSDIYWFPNPISASYGESTQLSITGIKVGFPSQLATANLTIHNYSAYGMRFDDVVNDHIYLTGVQYGGNVTANVRNPASPTAAFTVLSNA